MSFSLIMTKTKKTKTETRKIHGIFHLSRCSVHSPMSRFSEELDLPLFRTERLAPHDSSRWVPGWFGYN